MTHIEKLTFTRVTAQQPAGRGLSYSTQPGKIFGFPGPSGAGKSTTHSHHRPLPRTP